VAVRKPAARPLTAEEKRIQDRIARVKKHRSPVDRTSNYHVQLGDLAKECGVTFDVAYEEWSERAAAREYMGNMSRDEAEFLAMDDVRQRWRKSA
jgi:hypothetical protein